MATVQVDATLTDLERLTAQGVWRGDELDGPAHPVLVRYKTTHDPQLANLIVRAYLPLAQICAYSFAGPNVVSRDELVAVANEGLMNALDRFDPAQGTGFSHFAWATMAGLIMHFYRDHARLVRATRSLADLHGRIRAASEELLQEKGEASEADLARALGVTAEDIRAALVAAESTTYYHKSLDAPVAHGDEGDGLALIDVLGAIDANIERVVDREALKAAMGRLSDRDRLILGWRFFEGVVQTEIAKRLKISQMQVSRVLARALTRLRQALQSDEPLAPDPTKVAEATAKREMLDVLWAIYSHGPFADEAGAVLRLLRQETAHLELTRELRVVVSDLEKYGYLTGRREPFRRYELRLTSLGRREAVRLFGPLEVQPGPTVESAL
jgi:RNA polymerase sigma-B factor